LTKEIDEIQDRTKLTLHLPTDKLENVKEAYEFFKDHDYLNMTLHPFINFKAFADFYFSISEENARNISVENPENDIFFEFCDYLREEVSNLFITMDYGHLLLDKRSVDAFYKRFSTQITEIHFHGANEKKSHCYPDQKTIDDFKNFLKDKKLSPDFPVCIELFNLEETKRLAEELKSK
jgi:sugar phosphate isomerase/epimerase